MPSNDRRATTETVNLWEHRRETPLWLPRLLLLLPLWLWLWWLRSGDDDADFWTKLALQHFQEADREDELFLGDLPLRLPSQGTRRDSALNDVLQALRSSRLGVIDVSYVEDTFGKLLSLDEEARVARTLGDMPELKTLRSYVPLGFSLRNLAEVISRSQPLKKIEIYLYPSANLEDVAQLASAIAMSSLEEVGLLGFQCSYHKLLLEGLAQCHSLQSLEFECETGCCGIARLIIAMPNVRKLTLRGAANLWMSVAAALLSTTPSLLELEIGEFMYDLAQPDAFCRLVQAVQGSQSLTRVALTLQDLGYQHESMKIAIEDLLKHNTVLESLDLAEDECAFIIPLSHTWTSSDFARLSHAVAENGKTTVNLADMFDFQTAYTGFGEGYLREHYAQEISEHETVSAYERELIRINRRQVEVENTLNLLGRRTLSLNLGDHRLWFEALLKLRISTSRGREDAEGEDADVFQVSCFFGFFKKNPSLFGREESAMSLLTPSGTFM